jgi:hypothetical protein
MGRWSPAAWALQGGNVCGNCPIAAFLLRPCPDGHSNGAEQYGFGVRKARRFRRQKNSGLSAESGHGYNGEKSNAFGVQPFLGVHPMNANNDRLELPDLSHFDENQRKFPPEELAKYWGKHVAYSPDGTRIVASGDTWDELDAALDAAGIDFTQVVYSSYVHRPDVSWIPTLIART